MTLCTSGVFSTTTIVSPSKPPYPSSAIAAVPFCRSRSRYPSSTHARATTRAPFCGPTSFSYRSTTASIGVGGDQPLLDEERLERSGPDGDVVVLVVVVVAHACSR